MQSPITLNQVHPQLPFQAPSHGYTETTSVSLFDPIHGLQYNSVLSVNPLPLWSVRPRFERVPQPLYHLRGIKQPSASIVVLFQTSEGTAFPARAALEKDYVHLRGRDDPMTELQTGASMYTRIQWPGYKLHTRQVRTIDSTKAHNLITRAKLATEVAKSLKMFIETAQERTPIAEENRRWVVGPTGSISIDNVVLFSIEKVSKGSWQPVFFIV